MKKLSTILSSLFLVVIIGTLSNAYAVPIIMEFTANQLVNPQSGGVAPTDPVNGIITWEASSTNATIDYLTSVDLVIGNHSYQLAEIGYESPWYGNLDIIGGVNAGVNGMRSGTNDFWIDWNRDTLTPRSFAYYVESLEGYWHTTTFSFFSVEAAAPVSEPATIILIGTGLIGLASLSRRKVGK